MRTTASKTNGRGLGWHRAFTALVLAVAILLSVFLGRLGAEGSLWAWIAFALPILYVIGALLYRWESKLLIPGWAGQAIELSAMVWPPIKWLATSDEVQAANEAFVNDFNLTLEEYGLPPLVQGRKLAQRGRPLTTHALAEQWREEQAAASSKGAVLPRVDTLVLLHRERSGEVTVNLAQARKEHLMEDLAGLVLRNRRRLHGPDPMHPYSEPEVLALLSALRDFDVDFIAEELRAVDRLGARLQRYADFLWKGREGEAPKVGDITSLIRRHGSELPSGRSTLFRLEDPATAMRLMEDIEKAGKLFLAAVHRGIFLSEQEIDAGALKEQACAVVSQWSEDGDPIRVLQAYLWEKGRRAEAPISPDELDSKWRTWSDDAKAELEKNGPGDFAANRGRLAERLEAGIWPTRRSRDATDTSNPYPVAPPVSLPEHEEVRDPDAYLITFDERSGPLAKLIDGLKSRSDQKQIYRFGPYTRYTRLGVVPRGMPFHEFVERFLADLDGELRRYRSERGSPASGERALRFVAGRPHSIVLEHDDGCEGPVEFAITTPPRRCNRHGKFGRMTRTRPADGLLGEIEPWPGLDTRRALVRYFPSSVARPRTVCFEYTSRCGDKLESHSVQLLVQPKGQESPLDQVEVTVNRVDLAHCREAWFGDSRLDRVMRPPSIYDVWETIAPELEEDEWPSVKDAFDRVAGGRAHHSAAAR